MPSTSGVDVRHLRAFVAVAEELHFGRAALRLHMAQPPLSQLIRGLEASLGAQLFERTSRSVRLTPAGELLLDRARDVLRDLDRAIEDVARAERGELGSVRLGFTDLSAIELVPRIAARFSRDHPGVQLHLRGTFYSGEAVGMVADGTLDAALIHGPLVQAGVESAAIGTDRLVVALPSEHRLADRSEVALADLAGEDWLTYPEDRGSVVREAVLAACASAGFRPRIAQGVQESMALVAMVAAGFGVAVLPTSLMAFCPPGVVYRSLAGPPHELAVTICWNSARVTAALRNLIDTVLATEYVRPALTR